MLSQKMHSEFLKMRINPLLRHVSMFYLRMALRLIFGGGSWNIATSVKIGDRWIHPQLLKCPMFGGLGLPSAVSHDFRDMNNPESGESHSHQIMRGNAIVFQLHWFTTARMLGWN